ncbi:hypothetical protein SEA_MALIBO_15 [Gordonia phage Malibo]|nr:hypothetical protein SEA_MALIBO_15 [Gordonia phage Malibo]
MARIPSDDEIQSAAERLTREGVKGLLADDGRVRHEKRAQVARATQIAATETRIERTVTTNASSFAARIHQLEQALDEQGCRYETTARVLGAVAAPLWRDMKETTAHDTKR